MFVIQVKREKNMLKKHLISTQQFHFRSLFNINQLNGSNIHFCVKILFEGAA